MQFYCKGRQVLLISFTLVYTPFLNYIPKCDMNVLSSVLGSYPSLIPRPWSPREEGPGDEASSFPGFCWCSNKRLRWKPWYKCRFWLRTTLPFGWKPGYKGRSLDKPSLHQPTPSESLILMHSIACFILSDLQFLTWLNWSGFCADAVWMKLCIHVLFTVTWASI